MSSWIASPRFAGLAMTICLAALCFGAFPSASVFAGHSVGNIDDSFALERVTLSLDGKLFAWDGQGNLLSNWPIDLSESGRQFILTPRLVDLDSDGRFEILAVSQGADGGYRLHVYNGLAQELAHWSRDISTGGVNLTATPLVGNVQGDNAFETIFSDADGNIHILDATGNLLPGFPQNLGATASLSLADLQNRGRPQLFGVAGSSIYVWEEDEATGELSYGIFFGLSDGHHAIGELASHDINQDGFQELLFSTSENRIYVVDRNGEAVQTIPVQGETALLSSVSVGDVNLDGRPDILAILADGTKVAYQSDGSTLNTWLQEIEYRQYHEPSVGRIVNEIYNGAFSSATGLDFYTSYLSRLGRFAVLELGKNVHEWDRHAQFYFAQAAGITDVAARPLVFTPNGDGVNDVTELHYNLSEEAAVTINLFDSNHNLISNLVRNQVTSAGNQSLTWDGINQRGTRTTNDDAPVSAGVYILEITATTEQGLISRAEARSVVFGMTAEIEFPEEDAAVFGTIAVRGVAFDPHIGENESGFDFNSYKLYYRPGEWEVSLEEIATVGSLSSPWEPVSVPLRLQSPANVSNEPNDTAYPNSNVGVSPVQHGLLGSWDTAQVSNGTYTLLLKVIEGDLNTSLRFSYDAVSVNVANGMAVAGGGAGGGEGSDGGESGGSGSGGGAGGGSGGGSVSNDAPRLENVNPSTSEITERVHQSTIFYTLTGKPSDISVTISRVGAQVVYTRSFLNRAPEQTYAFSWNGTDNLGRTLPNGMYSVEITATATDGFGQARNNSAAVNININDVLTQDLRVIQFISSLESFNPLDDDADLPARAATMTYALNKPAQVTLEIIDGDGNVRRNLLTNHLSQVSGDSPPVWDGTDQDGLILPFGTYMARLTAVGVEVGREETVTEVITIALASPEYDEALRADLSTLMGDSRSDATNDQERGMLVNNDNPDDDFPLEGNPDFYWQASGTGNVVLDLEYNVRGEGMESYSYATEAREDRDFSFTANIPECPFSVNKGLIGCDPGDTRRTGDFTFSDGGEFNSWGFTVLGAGICYGITAIAYGGSGNEVNRISDPPRVNVGETATQSSCPGCRRLHYDIEVCEDDAPLNIRFFMIRQTSGSGERPWGPTETGWVSHFGLNAGTQQLGSFPESSIGTGAGDVTGISVQNYTYEVRELLNNEYRTAAFSACDGGIKRLPFADVWMGAESGPDTSDCISHTPTIYGNVSQGAFTTAQDTALENGNIRSLFANFNEDDYRILGDPIIIYDHYQARETHPDLYTFSNIVRIHDWDIQLRYPNGDPVEAFQVMEREVHGEAGLDTDGNGIPDVNDNTQDSFRLRLRPDAVPRRFIEIRGNVDTPEYELKYYDARRRIWLDIPTQLSAAHEDGTRTLGWWDVTQLNGRNFTLLLRVENAEGRINEQTMRVGLGRRVNRGESSAVRDAFGRAVLQFDDNTLGADSENELISITPVQNNDPLLPPLHLPSGTVPVGPVYNLQPDGINIDPAHPVQLEITYTCEEVWNAFGSNPAEITIYNLTEEGELEIVSTLNPAGDSCPEPDPNRYFRIVGQLEHFSNYIMLKDAADIPSFSITAPEREGRYNTPLRITGQISGPELEWLRIGYFETDDPSRSITNFYEGTTRNFDFSWEADLESGDYTLVLEVLNSAGLGNGTEIPVYLDTEPPSTLLTVDGELVAPGQSVFISEESEIALTAGEAQTIQYRIDEGSFAEYAAPFTLDGRPAGRHSIVYRALDDLGNLEANQSATLILRGEEGAAAPFNLETALVVNGPQFAASNEMWVSPQSELTIGAIRANNELAFISYRYLGGEWNRYENSIPLAGLKEGLYTLEYFGTDINERDEGVHIFDFSLDAAPPTTTLKLNGRFLNQSDRYLIGRNTEIELSAEDRGSWSSGVERIEYRLDGGGWQTYAGAFTISSGNEIVLEARATDRVGNVEAAKAFQLELDHNAPQVSLISTQSAFSPNGDGVQDQWELSVDIDDNFSEALFATLRVDGRLVWEDQPIGRGENSITWDGASFAEGRYAYELIVEDEAGNHSEPVVGTLILDNTPPVLDLIGGAELRAGGNGITLNYTLDDNFEMENISVDFVLVSSNGSPLSRVSDAVVLPPSERNIVWSGLNLAANTLPDGTYRYTLSAKDAAGNESEAVQGELAYDAAPPITQLKFIGQGREGWINANTQLILEATDYGLGVDSTFYRLDGASLASSYTSPFTLAESGEHSLGYWSIDLAGNQEMERVADLRVDVVLPQTTLDFAGIHYRIDGLSHISGAASELVLEAQDEHSGVDRIRLQIDGHGAVDYAGPVRFFDYGDGMHTVNYWAIDRAGNEEEARLTRFILHGSPPELFLTFGEPKFQGGSLYITSETPVQVRAASNMADIDLVAYQVGGASETRFDVESLREFSTPPFTFFDEGNQTITYRVMDHYQNPRALSQSVVVDNTPPETELTQSLEIPGDLNFVSPSTTFTLQATDNLSGVERTEFSIDGGDWRPYDNPFDLTGLADGSHHIVYRSKDNLNHVEGPNQQNVELVSVSATLVPSIAPRILIYQLSNNNEERRLSPTTLFLEEITAAEPWHYQIVHNGSDFITELRSDVFDLAVFVTDEAGYTFERSEGHVKIFGELTERIHNGLGVAVLADHGVIQGEAWQNMWSQFGISEEESLLTLGRGRVRQFEINPAKRISALPEEERESARDDFRNSLTALKSAEEKFSPLEVIALDILLQAKELPVNIGVEAVLPENVTLVKALAADGDRANWAVDLEPEEARRLRFLTRLPATQQEIEFGADTETTWENGLTYELELTKEQNMEAGWQDLWTDAVTRMQNITRANDLPEGLFALLSDTIRQFEEEAQKEPLEPKIDLILDVMRDLRPFFSREDVTDLRYHLDETMEVLALQSSPALNFDVIPDEPEADGETKQDEAAVVQTKEAAPQPAGDQGPTQFTGGGGGCQLDPKARGDLYYVLCTMCYVLWIIRRKNGERHKKI